jgi:hypothetical protein
MNCTTSGTTNTTLDNAAIAAGSGLVISVPTVSVDGINLSIIIDVTMDD